MGIRNISYTVSAGGISPSNSVFGGTQRDHNPTRVDFHINSALKSALVSEAEEKSGTVYYRFDVYDGDENIIRVESEELGNKSTVSLPLTENITRNGGRITVYLVFTIISVTGEGEDKTELNLFSFPAHLSLNNLPNAYIEGDHNARDSLTTLAEAAKRAAANALTSETNSKESENSVRSDRERVETAKASFENATWVFDGNGGRDEEDPEIDIHYAVDDTISPSSTNALQNRAIYNALVAWKNEILAQAKLDAHPLWSLYWNMDKTMTEAEANNPNSLKHPHTLFGGTWERITDKFILAAGGEHKVNDYPIVEVDGKRPESFAGFMVGNYYTGNHTFTRDAEHQRYISHFELQFSVDGTEYKNLAISWYTESCEFVGTVKAKNHIEIEGLIADESQGSIWKKIPRESNLEIYMSDGTAYTITPEMTAQAAQQNTSIDPEIVLKGIGGASKHISSIQEMPEHSHQNLIWDETKMGLTDYMDPSPYDPGNRCLSVDGIHTQGVTTNPRTGNSGSSQPHNNMPPYKTGYCWVRIA